MRVSNRLNMVEHQETLEMLWSTRRRNHNLMNIAGLLHSTLFPNHHPDVVSLLNYLTIYVY